jgi:hypothetical protein
MVRYPEPLVTGGFPAYLLRHLPDRHFSLQLRKDFGHSFQPWLTPIPGSLFEKECLLVSINAFVKLDPNHTRIS